MIKRGLIAISDQALLSVLNFALALLLIKFAGKEQYGLYSELINLQPLLSPLHAGVFVSAFLAIAARQGDSDRARYEAVMSRAEVLFSGVGAALAVLAVYVGSLLLEGGFSLAACCALGLSLLGLWWREFTRARHFSRFDHASVLRVDLVYAVIVGIGCLACVLSRATSATLVIACTGVAAMAATAGPLFAARRTAERDNLRSGDDLRASWAIGKWEVYGSLFTWASAQSYVYFAALTAGVDGAAEISAARLMSSPLALVWISMANILRPRASQLLRDDQPAKVQALGWRAAAIVVSISLVYAAATQLALPLFARSFLGSSFRDTGGLAMLWIAYFGLTGLTTVAASLLRSALEFRRVFIRQAWTSSLTVVLMLAGFNLRSLYTPIACLIAVEIISAVWLWREAASLLGRPRVLSAASA